MTAAAPDLASWVVWGGFALAFLFGAIAHRSNFCTMGALSDIVNMDHWGRMRMWLLAIAVAVAASAALSLTGQVDLGKSVVQRPVLPWLSLVVGGLAFGVGMTMSGGCANKNLVRLGGGSVRSLVVLVFMAIAAYMTLKGLFGQWRAALLDPVAIDLAASGWKDQSLGTALARVGGLEARAAQIGVASAVVLALLAFSLKDRRFRANRVQVASGIALGLLVAAGWYVSGHLGYGENPETLETVFHGTNSRTLESLSFVGPTAYTLELLMLWTDKSLHATMGIASVLGVVAGSAMVALATRSFRWEGFASLADLRNQLIGAGLMGFGGVTALGCTVGQGLSGISTLAIGSFIALAGIVAGSVLTLKVMLWKMEQE
ncbi:YeeE/YedE family protein [Ideonella sp. A 288]|uniref:YeeE/YedE family protein n=1 Tax=Ideonella sp. A 288 TaxID=1962181 RepID=UPI000B4AFEB2|nr:YeeE/YedE family protein [Ideonella sp. A 288]